MLVLGAVLHGAAWAECGSAARADWMDIAPPLSMPVRPADCETVNQTPPDLAWPQDRGQVRYEIELTQVDGQRSQALADRNWFLWPEALAPGEYRWRVRAQGKGEWSRWRSFRVSDDAVSFVVPSAAVLAQMARSKPHPRAFPRGAEAESLLRALDGPRRHGFARLLSRLATAQPDYADEESALVFGERSAYASKSARIKKGTAPAIDQLLGASFAWQVKRETKYLDLARAQLRQIVAWNAGAGTGASQHQVAGRLVWSLALAYDWLHDELSHEERRAVLEAVAARMDGLLKEFRIASGNLDGMPYNSHGWVALGEMAAASALLVGDDPRAERWFELSVRPFAFLLSPWAGHDSGMGNGTAYGMWDLTALMLPMDILKHATGMDLYRKAYLRNLGKFMLQFQPPGSPTMLFGDAAEQSSGLYVGDFARAYAQRVPDPLSQWYAQQWVPRKIESLVNLFAPPTEPPDWLETPEGLAHGMHALSTGWVAMHGDILDRKRMSVYFRSSPYGSFNHAHADQNGFVVVADGKPVLIDSGYRDYNGSPHARQWYTATRAHNAITFDGGKGQEQGSRGAAGSIVAYQRNPAFDIVSGEASPAYAGQTSQARRSLLLLRPDRLVIYDRLASPVARTWEWNFHGASKFVQTDNAVRVQYEGGEACLTFLLPESLGFEQSAAFPVPPDTRQAPPPQWHGKFFTRQPQTEATFVAVLDRQCRNPSGIALKRDGPGFSLLAGEQRFYLTAEGEISLR